MSTGDIHVNRPPTGKDFVYPGCQSMIHGKTPRIPRRRFQGIQTF